MACPAREVIRSPWATPACAAAEPETTPATVAPLPAEMPPKNPALEDATATPRNAVPPVCTAEDDVPASIWLAIEAASLIGMANAWVCACPACAWNPVVEADVEA